MKPSRRSLLALVAAGTAGAPVTARAFRVERADAATEAELVSRMAACSGSGSGLHDQVREEVAALLEGRSPPPLVEAEIRSLSTCPLCGCAVASLSAHMPRD